MRVYICMYVCSLVYAMLGWQQLPKVSVGVGGGGVYYEQICIGCIKLSRNIISLSQEFVCVYIWGWGVGGAQAPAPYSPCNTYTCYSSALESVHFEVHLYSHLHSMYESQ